MRIRFLVLAIFFLSNSAVAQTAPDNRDVASETSSSENFISNGTRLLAGFEVGVPNIYDRGAWAAIRLPINPIHFSLTGEFHTGHVSTTNSILNLSAAITADLFNRNHNLIELTAGPYYGLGMASVNGVPSAGVGYLRVEQSPIGEFGFYSSMDVSHLTTDRLGFGAALFFYTARSSTFLGLSFQLLFLP